MGLESWPTTCRDIPARFTASHPQTSRISNIIQFSEKLLNLFNPDVRWLPDNIECPFPTFASATRNRPMVAPGVRRCISRSIEVAARYAALPGSTEAVPLSPDKVRLCAAMDIDDFALGLLFGHDRTP